MKFMILVKANPDLQARLAAMRDSQMKESMAANPDPVAAKRSFDAMMTMKQIDITAIEAARLGRSGSSAL